MDIMDIKKLTTHLQETQTTRQSNHSSGIRSTGDTQNSTSDKVSLDGYQFKKDEVLFAKSEYDKLSRAAFEKLTAAKAQLTEYEKAKADPDGKAAETEMGQKLNDPDVWDKIARKIMDF